eukprot:766555-Hanusia_phi.AAC.15
MEDGDQAGPGDGDMGWGSVLTEVFGTVDPTISTARCMRFSSFISKSGAGNSGTIGEVLNDSNCLSNDRFSTTPIVPELPAPDNKATLSTIIDTPRTLMRLSRSRLLCH